MLNATVQLMLERLGNVCEHIACSTEPDFERARAAMLAVMQMLRATDLTVLQRSVLVHAKNRLSSVTAVRILCGEE